ncbi:hypothetical protein [Priestia aryabhattai]|uniref:hypothetical protein n=1 Tax=Priestia aryabhattai TaxID=412384 RepID=UPI001C8E5128|nr:hypothetical protein [Priestia aryabhattai]MBY0213881.1 hypothetical protein [Priestia aryabhattai]
MKWEIVESIRMHDSEPETPHWSIVVQFENREQIEYSFWRNSEGQKIFMTFDLIADPPINLTYDDVVLDPRYRLRILLNHERLEASEKKK